jgi:hypothetical protein
VKSLVSEGQWCPAVSHHLSSGLGIEEAKKRAREAAEELRQDEGLQL